MFELGYAFKAKNSSKVLMVFNEAYGNVKSLPFYLGLKRQITYSLNENEDKSEQSKFLYQKLQKAIESIIKEDND